MSDTGARLIALVAVVFLLIFVPIAYSETTYCAFEIRVSKPSGAVVSKVPVYLIRDQRKTLSSTLTDESGVAKFCDAPMGALDIGVGVDVCGSVLVRDVRATWPETQRLFVTYADIPCPHFTFENRCLAVFRVQDENGHPITGAQFKGTDSEPGSQASDIFGRIFRSTKRGGKLEGVIAGKGFEPAQISATCVEDMESKVVLRK